MRGNEAIFLEIGKSSALFTEEQLHFELTELSRKFTISSRIVFADDVCLALAFARFGCTQEGDLPLEALKDLISPFHIETESRPHIESAIRAFYKLGLSKIGELSHLPSEAFSSRFGKEIAWAASYLHNRQAHAWPAFVPTEIISEHASTEDADTLSACYNIEAAFPILEQQLERVSARLQARGRAAAAISIKFELDSHERLEWGIQLAFPQAETSSLMRILQEKLRAEAGRRPFPSPLVASTITVTETVNASQEQKDFFNRQIERDSSLGALVEVLSAKLGKERVFFAQQIDRYLPEKAWERRSHSRIAAVESSIPLPSRPTRLLQEPVRLRRNRDELVCAQRRWKISSWIGPERISEEWWFNQKNQSSHRDYYQVLSKTGEKLWIFESAGSIYLHGFFD